MILENRKMVKFGATQDPSNIEFYNLKRLNVTAFVGFVLIAFCVDFTLFTIYN